MQGIGAALAKAEHGGPIVCIGYSHAGVLWGTGREQGRDIDAIMLWYEQNAVGSDGALRPDLAARVRQGRCVLAAVDRAGASVVGLVEHHRPFDFVLPAEPDLPVDPARELVPADGVRAAIAAAEAPVLGMLEQLAKLAQGPIVQVEPPPPAHDNGLVARHVPWGFWPGQPRAVAPPLLRYKLWRLGSEVLAETCARAGVHYLRVPKAAQDDAGFMREGLSLDGFHGDTPYGELLWNDLERAA